MKLTIFTDGASRGNPGLASYGFVIFDETEQLVLEEGQYIGITTNNVAEYSAVMEALRKVKQEFADTLPIEIVFKADSKLVVEQLSGRYKIKSEHLKVLINKIRILEKEVGKISYQHIPREENKLADRMANIAIDER